MNQTVSEMSPELKKILEEVLGIELLIMDEQGAVPPAFKPMLEDVYTRIAAREPINEVTASMNRLRSALEALR